MQKTSYIFSLKAYTHHVSRSLRKSMVYWLQNSEFVMVFSYWKIQWMGWSWSSNDIILKNLPRTLPPRRNQKTPKTIALQQNNFVSFLFTQCFIRFLSMLYHNTLQKHTQHTNNICQIFLWWQRQNMQVYSLAFQSMHVYIFTTFYLLYYSG